jgi:quinol monooxygenase YgiN
MSAIALFSMATVYAQNQVTMSTTNYAVEIIRYTIADGERNSFEAAYSTAGTILQSSPYCLGYEIIHGTDEPANYIVRIHWTSVEDHLNGFRKSKEFMAFFDLVKPFYNDIREMKHYEQTSAVWTRP